MVSAFLVYVMYIFIGYFLGDVWEHNWPFVGIALERYFEIEQR